MSVSTSRTPKTAGSRRPVEPAGRKTKNVEAVQEAYAALRRGDNDSFLAMLDPEVEWYEPSEMQAGDHVVVMGSFHGRPKRGSEVDAPCVQVWKMSRGKAVRVQDYTDTARLAAAFDQ